MDANRGKRTLVVDDDELVCDIIAAVVEGFGFDVIKAKAPAQALAICAELPQLDLLVTDIRMPGAIDGWGLAERVRSIHPHVPVIYVTGYSDQAARPVPRSRLILKPFRTAAFANALVGLSVRP